MVKRIQFPLTDIVSKRELSSAKNNLVQLFQLSIH